MLTTDTLLDPLRNAFGRVRHPGGDSAAELGDPFVAIVEALPDALVVLSPEGTILYANAAWRRFRSLTLEQAIGTDIVELADTCERRTSAEERRGLLRSLTPADPTTVLSFSNVDGACLDVTYRGWFSAEGELVVVAGMARDVSDDRRLEEERKAVIHALEESNRDLEDFAFVAGHDLQEPLRKIIAFSGRLSDRHADQLDELGLDYLDRVTSAATRMQQLIRSLLGLARINGRTPEFADVDLDLVVKAAVADLELAVEQSAATVSIRTMPTIHADAVQMRQLFQNLIGNALKYRSRDRPPQVDIRAERDADRWVIAVADNGIGFEPEQAARLFDPLHRLQTREDYEGTGLGLAVCSRIVQRHGGTISATGVPDAGATFTVVLPTRPE